MTGQTVVAEVWPFCSDSNRQALDLLSDRKYQELTQFLRNEMSITSKFDHAALKICRGEIDPVITQQIIGRWTHSPSTQPREVSC